MPANSLNDLFRHGLGDIYDAERPILSVLDQMETETVDDTIRNRVRKHRNETEQQIQNLERCFELLSAQAPRVQCAAIRGLRNREAGLPAGEPVRAGAQGLQPRLGEQDRALRDRQLPRPHRPGPRARPGRRPPPARTEPPAGKEGSSRWIEEHQPEVLTRMQGVEGRSGARVRR